MIAGICLCKFEISNFKPPVFGYAQAMKKTILTVLALLVLGVIAAPFVGAWLLRRYVEKDFLVEQIEKNINARVHIDEVTLTLFSWPPSLRISGFKVAERDEHVGRPLSERPALTNAPLNVEMAYAELVPEDLLHGRFSTKVIRIIGLDATEIVSAESGGSLERLFQPPPEKRAPMQSAVQGDAVPRAIPVEEPAPPTQAVVSPSAPRTYAMHQEQEAPRALPVEPASAAPVGSQRVPLREISIEQSRLRMRNEGAGARFDGEISDFNLHITEIDIDPANLAGHNHLKVRLSAKAVLDGMAELGGQMRQVRFADMALQGEGDVNPIDPATLTWNPAATLNLAVAKDSVLGGHMTLGDAAGGDIDKLLKYGVDLRGIRVGGPLQQDLAVKAHLRNQQMTFLDDTHLVMPEYQVTIKRDSWFDFAKDDQGLLARLYLGGALKEQVVRGVAARGLGQSVSRMIVDAFSDSSGRLAFDLTIAGSLSHPQVKPDIQVKLEQLLGGDLEQKARGLIDSFKGLKSLFK